LIFPWPVIAIWRIGLPYSAKSLSENLKTRPK
jgi:hypothetical protein